MADDPAMTDAESDMDPRVAGEWLREDVAPVYDLMFADPGRALAADEVMHAVREHHEARQKSRLGA